MSTRERLLEQRHSMYREYWGSRTMWMTLALVAGFLLGSSLGDDFGPRWFWRMIAFGLGGLFVQIIHLLRGRHPRETGES